MSFQSENDFKVLFSCMAPAKGGKKSICECQPTCKKFIANR
jgi:hypothetical protein